MAVANENANEALIRKLREHVADLECWLARKSIAPPVVVDEVANQLATSEGAISAHTAGWETKVEFTESHLAEMTDWQNGDAAEIRHALASERWRFATTGVADDVKMVHEHDRALVSKTALADRIMELEVELAAEKAKNAASAEVRDLPIPSHCSLSSRVLSTWGS